MNEIDSEMPGVRWSYRLTQVLFTLITTACFLIFWYASRLLGIPAESHHGGSLLRQPTTGNSIIALLAYVVLLIGCTLLASAFLRRRWFLASLCAATAGLSAWSMRGGPMHEVLVYAQSSAVFVQLAIELMLLGALVALMWLFLWRAASGVLEPTGGGDVVGSVLIQTVLMCLIVLILAQTDAKKQCVAAVLIAAFVSTSVIHSNGASPQAGRWYWVAPILVGVIGYLLAAMQTQGWQTGSRELEGFWAPLARPLPLDYASVGMFGALLGYWTSIPDGETLPNEAPAVSKSGVAPA